MFDLWKNPKDSNYGRFFAVNTFMKSMTKRYMSYKNFLFIAFFFASLSFSNLSAQETPLLSQMELGPHGLMRTWFNQVQIDTRRSNVAHAIVEGGAMFVVTDDGQLHAINAETGKTLWVRNLGNRDSIFMEPSVNSRMVSVLNASQFFVYDRRNGKLLMSGNLSGASSTACEMSENYIYIPLINGRIVVYPLLDRDVQLESDGGEARAANANTGPQNDEDDQTDEADKEADKDDPVLANITKRFAEAKSELYPVPKEKQIEEPIVLQPAVGIPMVTQSFGNVLVKPKLSSQILVYTPKGLVRSHREVLTWVNDRGHFVAASINGLSQEKIELQYMVDSSAQNYYLGSDKIAQREWTMNKDLVARPTINQCVPYLYTSNSPDDSEIPSLALVGSKGSYLFAVKDRTGEVTWQFAASGPITERIGVIGTDVYCPTATTGLHALDLKTGEEKWFTPDIRKFVAASKKRLYAVDKRERLVVLDRETGNSMTSFDIKKFEKILFNVETDRIYLVNKSGLIQCLVERQAQPVDDLLSGKPAPVVRHRLTHKQYMDVFHGGKGPNLYWLQSDGGADDSEEGAMAEEETADEEDLFGTSSSKKKSGEDGSLDGDEMDEEIKPKKSAPSKKQESNDDEEDDPFG